MQKLTLTLVRSEGEELEAFARRARTEIAIDAVASVAGARTASITVAGSDAFNSALVPAPVDVRAIDAVLEIETAQDWAAVDPLLDYLQRCCRHVQGWRANPTVIFDASGSLALGERSAWPRVFVFIKRLDGTAPEHFDRNWYIHAGHANGQAAESDQSRAERASEEARQPGMRYVQNRFVEPLTPSAWVSHGYTQLVMPMLIPEAPSAYERVRGEAAFETWPPRIFQGYEYRVL